MDLAKKMPGKSTAIKATADGYLYLDVAAFHADFAADVPDAQAQFMSISQVMPNAASFGTPIKNPAWKAKPSFALVATSDRAINPDLERFMAKRAGSTTVEVNSSHVAYISHPKEVAALIEQAATTSVKP
jgi:pimeloyl-ACP methyl ester carboxylesterase